MKNPSLQLLMRNLTATEEEQVLAAVSGLLLQSKLFEWMKETLLEAHDLKHWDFFIHGNEVDVTFLAEEAIRESGYVLEDQILDTLEDEDHGAWDAAVDAANWWQQEKGVPEHIQGYIQPGDHHNSKCYPDDDEFIRPIPE